MLKEIKSLIKLRKIKILTKLSINLPSMKNYSEDNIKASDLSS